ncbi:MAG: hypothetical protein U0802_05375 [Candidatus Binatia bacterium]
MATELRRILAPVVAAAVLAAGTALAGVGASAPEACPLRFDQPTTGLQQTCLFVGHFRGSDRELMAVFAGDGSAVVVAIASGDAKPLLYLPASVDSATAGTLIRSAAGVERASDVPTGVLTLEDGGRRLRLLATRSDAQSGSPAEFVGLFTAMVSAERPVLSQR